MKADTPSSHLAGATSGKKSTILDEIPGYGSWLAVARASHLCHRQLAQVLEPLGLEVAHYDVLANVARDEGLSQQVLARRLLVAKSNVSALTSVLERRGLLQRLRHQSDARVRLVILTAEGRRITQRAMKAHAEIVSAMLNVLNSDEVKIVHAAMDKIAVVLDPQHHQQKAVSAISS
jgi:MarR family transcriptional regulator, organic hydroperoxide resistance regulator